jgi:tRNA (guanine37-N1)-methyltransferase
MRIDIFTIFPGMLEAPLRESLLGKARERGLIEVAVHDIRDYAEGRHLQTDDSPFGGGPGMVMKPEPVFEAVLGVLGYSFEDLPRLKREARVILTTPRGRRLDQGLCEELAGEKRLAVICGRYEGVDERVREHLCTDSISIGDYVLSGGEAAALVLTEAVTRLVPGVLGNEESLGCESFAGGGTGGGLEYPQYTRPADYRGWKVPEVLLSGNHAEVEKWRREESLRVTREVRPDLAGEGKA